MVEINLIKIEGKPLQKLIDVISKGIGVIYKPRAIRKEAEAEAYKIEIIENARAMALANGKIMEAETLDKIQERFIVKELKRQENLERITQIAVDQMSIETSVSDMPLTDDWVTRFFNIAEDISDTEVQKLWGRILAGEVKKPNSYSLRTLDVLRNMTKDDANSLSKISKFAISNTQNSFILSYRLNSSFYDQFNLTTQELISLDELQVIKFTEMFFELDPTKNLEKDVVFKLGNYIIIQKMEPHKQNEGFEVIPFTTIGKQLLNLLNETPEIEYVKRFSHCLNWQNGKIKYGKIIEEFSDGRVSFEDKGFVPI